MYDKKLILFIFIIFRKIQICLCQEAYICVIFQWFSICVIYYVEYKVSTGITFVIYNRVRRMYFYQ